MSLSGSTDYRQSLGKYIRNNVHPLHPPARNYSANPHYHSTSSMVQSPLGLLGLLFPRFAGSTPSTITPGRNRQASRSEISNLFPNQFLKPHTVELLILKGPVKGRLAHRLIVWVVQLLQKRMLQSLLHCNTLPGMDLQHLAQQIKSIVGGSGELTTQTGHWLVGKLAHESLRFLRCDEIHVGFGELAKLLRDEGELREGRREGRALYCQRPKYTMAQ